MFLSLRNAITGALLLGAAGVASAADAASAATQYVDVDGDRIAYRTSGAGAPLLMPTRMRGTLDTWDPLFLDELAKDNLVVIFDYPGVGYSEGELPPSMSEAADFVKAFAETIGYERFAVAGWSWGGLVSQALLVEHPEVVTRAVLIGTNPPGPVEKDVAEYWKERAFKPVNDLEDEIILFFEPKSQSSREAAKASRERIYARPGVVEKIPATLAEFEAYFAAHADRRLRGAD